MPKFWLQPFTNHSLTISAVSFNLSRSSSTTSFYRVNPNFPTRISQKIKVLKKEGQNYFFFGGGKAVPPPSACDPDGMG
jgi:hypothetical protein